MSLTLIYNIFQLYLICIYNNTFNILNGFYLRNFYKLKNYIEFYLNYFFRKFFKTRNYYKFYYRFFVVDDARFIFYIFFCILFLLMWKRRNTYLIRHFIINLLFFYILGLLACFIIMPFFPNGLIGVIIGYGLIFLIIFIRLN